MFTLPFASSNSESNPGGARRKPRATTVWATVVALIAGIAIPVTGGSTATAAPGSLVSGVVWADVNRDGVHQSTEPVKAGIPIQLLTSPGGVVVATTTTSAAGVYRFPDVADGTFVVRADASAAFHFPATASGENDFVTTGPPPVGQPERGVTAPLTIAGTTQAVGIDAGMQPIADLSVARLPVAEGCDGFAVTGTPPFDATDAPGKDSGPGNCIVRVMDTVSQNYSVALTGLPTGASVPNVVAQFTVSSPDGAKLELVGPGTNGLPAGCLGAANGANPPSSRTVNADGSITVICNIGSLSSNVAALQLAYRFASNTPIPSHAGITMSAFAPAGDAGTSATVDGPQVEVTGTAQWDLEKIPYPPSGVGNAGPDFTIRTYNGVAVSGYLVRYKFNVVDTLHGAGASDLVWPATFTDVMPEFPNARITQCRSAEPADNSLSSPWTLTCPLEEVQGTDGWQLSIRPNSGRGSDTGEGHMIMTIFVPLDDMNRAIDPSWQPGQPNPTGTFDFQNRAQDTDRWVINGGAPNYGPDHEPGSNGTGNNLVTIVRNAAAPTWDLQKSFFGGPFFTTQTVNGVPVNGYRVDYLLNIVDLAGPDNVGPWLDLPVTFKDRLVSHPGALLTSCDALQPDPNAATVTCDMGAQPAAGWTIRPTPNQRGFNDRRMNIVVRFFIPMSTLPADPCQSNVTLDLRNEAIDSDPWTAGGDLNNGTGFEPGWNGTTATGNNLDVRSVRPSAGECGSLTGNKQYIRNGATYNGPTFGGDVVQSFVSLSANNNRVSVPDLKLCDVFDVSVLKLVAGTPRMGTFPSGTNVNPANYVIEYAVGPNQVNTQNGPPTGGLYPIDASSITGAATDCRNAPGPWTTDPAAAFGANWQDAVNMVRIRPVDPTRVETGPFAAHLIFELETRTFYNGGPNASEAIPSGVRVTNVGGWPTGATGNGWGTVSRQIPFSGMLLGVAKAIVPTQYFPGDTAIWDLTASISRTTVGATLQNLRLVDTIPADLHFDSVCTQNLLPPGVTVSYDQQTRRVTFVAGDIPIVTAPSQTVFSPTPGATRGRLRICTTVDSLAQPGDTHVNTVQALADNAENAPTAQATIQIVGSGQLGITKSVDKPFVASGETYTWSLEWGNTSTQIAFQPPDVIDVLPWNGDGDPASGSARSQYASDYTGTARLSGPLAAPTYLRGATGAVPGTWYYSSAPPATLIHDPRDPSNANPAAPGGLWQTAGEVADFGAVTAVRFVSSGFLGVQTRVRASIPAVSTSNDLDNVYVNRAMIFSATFANQPLLSNEPYVLMPGFSLGDLVWLDSNGDGKFDGGEHGIPGVAVQVLTENGDVVGTATTDANGRWSVTSLPAGRYVVHLPAAMFAAGGPLAGTVVRTTASSPALTPNEDADNNNTASPDPAATGLTSTPVTLANQYAAGALVGGNGPSGDDVAGLAGELIPDSFTAFTVDLAVLPAPGIHIEKATNTEDADDAPGPLVPVGGPVQWTYVVTNSGAVDLTDVTVTDDQVAAADIDCDATGGNVVAGPLAPGASFTCVATGTATAGQYANTGTVTGLDPAAVRVDDDDPSHYFGIVSGIDVVKSSTTTDVVQVGQQIPYSFLVTNTGNSPLTGITVEDVVAAPSDPAGLSAVDCPASALAGGASMTCTATYTTTQADLDSGSVTDTATATGTPPATPDEPNPPRIASPPVTVTLPVTHTSSITVLKSMAQPSTVPFTAGLRIPYDFLVTNTGNTVLTDIVVTDVQVAPAVQAALSPVDCPATTLAPQQDMICTATYEVSQADVDNGSLTDTAVATAVPAPRPDAPNPPAIASPPSSVTITADDLPGIRVEKSSTTTSVVRAGQQIPYTFLVTNTGNVPLTGITVDDQVAAPSSPGGLSPIDCPADPLPVGGQLTCTATYTTTQADVDNGSVTDTATASGTPPTPPGGSTPDPIRSAASTVTIAAADDPGLSVVKTSDTAAVTMVGQQVRFAFLVTNTGNVTLADVTVSDTVAAPSDQANLSAVDCPASILAPGERMTCSATYTTTASDLLLTAAISDRATAAGTAPDGTRIGSPEAVLTLPVRAIQNVPVVSG
ncbi:DUF7507 domain-containing protein [Leifsonia sp. 109]|uniref:DUF7507 domain-containing protein n=1 Tax=Leifsonia sp. 109 TaxID=1150399 RepID=UPI0009DA83F2|nr:SdrD B-like domain-containing protein [Leifsonia sp. 109]TDP99056.1 putative repeat protein (TIGR01451 family) [Leifsonia sp. 115AMFTsu3.1]